MSWYNQGYGDHERDAEREARRAYKPYRFWVRVGETRRAVVIDDTPFFFWEHQMKIGNTWDNYFTCSKGVYPDEPVCPLCARGIKRRYIGMVTIFDLNEYIGNDGEPRLSGRKILVLGKRSVERWKKLQSQAGGSLVGRVLEFYRSNDKADRVGDQIDLSNDRIDIMADKRLWYKDASGVLKPPTVFEYADLYEPLRPSVVLAEIKARMAMEEPVVGSADPYADEVPF